MPRKKTVPPDDQPVEGLTAQPGGEENDSQFPEADAFPDTAPGGENSGGGAPDAGEGQPDGVPTDPLADGDLPGEEPPADGEPPADAPFDATAGEEPLPGSAPDMPDAFPADGENPFPDLDGGDNPQPPDGLAPESDDPEYGALLQEWGEMGHGEAGAEEPLALGPPPGEPPRTRAGLSNAARSRRDFPAAMERVEAALALERVLHTEELGGLSASLRMMRSELLRLEGRLDEAMEDLTGYVEQSMALWERLKEPEKVKSPFYDRLSLSGVRMSAAYLAKNILLVLEQSEELAPLREREDFQNLLAKLREAGQAEQ